MSDLLGRWIPGLDPMAGTFTLPFWTAGALAALFVVFCMLAFDRAGRDGVIGWTSRAVLVLAGVAATWFVLDGKIRQETGADRRALEARASSLAARATMPGSPLACLDGAAGETVEGSCERALFATPEAAAAAVSYVATQLDLLADASEFVRRGGRRSRGDDRRLAPPYRGRPLRAGRPCTGDPRRLHAGTLPGGGAVAGRPAGEHQSPASRLRILHRAPCR